MPTLRPLLVGSALGGWVLAVGAGGPSLVAQSPPESSPSEGSRRSVADFGLHGRAEALADEGEWRAALDLWGRAPDSLPAEASDPRIGPAFIATALEHGADDRLTRASSLYLWSFTGRAPDSLAQFVLDEAKRTIPVLARRDSIRWQKLIDAWATAAPSGDQLSALSLDIARFWLESDPTPDTPLNERLVEHWQRIVDARSRFVRNRRGPYGTDARGAVYVRYGPPDDEIGGTLGGSEAELRLRVTEPAWLERMRRIDPHPDFSLWRYGDLNPRGYTYFLFGNVRGSGPFELVDGPYDLISDQARALGSRELTPGGVRGQYYLELFYYHDLAVLGGHYGRRFGELSNLWDGYTMRRNLYGANGKPSPTGPTLESYSLRFAEEDRYHPPGRPSVRLKSEYEGASRGTALVVQAVRLLGEDGRPQIVVQSLAAPRFLVDGREGRQAYRAQVRDTRHVLVVRDRELREAGRSATNAPAQGGGIAVFRFPNPNQPVHLSVYATPLGRPVASFDTLSLMGADHVFIEEPLSTDSDRFEMSDVAVGLPVMMGDPSDGGSSSLPFPLLPALHMWPGDAMRFYVELYRLRLTESEPRYELGFRLVRLDENWEPEESSEPVTVQIPMEESGLRVRRSFDVDLAGLSPGVYRLEVEASDLVSGQAIVRRAEIEVMELT